MDERLRCVLPCDPIQVDDCKTLRYGTVRDVVLSLRRERRGEERSSARREERKKERKDGCLSFFNPINSCLRRRPLPWSLYSGVSFTVVRRDERIELGFHP